MYNHTEHTKLKLDTNFQQLNILFEQNNKKIYTYIYQIY